MNRKKTQRFYREEGPLVRKRRGQSTAYNFARRPKTLEGLMPYEYICKI